MEKQIYTIPLSNGIDQKTDSKMLGATFSVLENAYYKKNGRLSKMPGFDLIRSEDINGVAISGKALEVFNDELLMQTSDSFYTYSTVRGQWKNRGKFYPVEIETKRYSVMGSFYNSFDTLTYAGFRLVAYGNSTLNIALYDATTNAIVIEEFKEGVDPKAIRILGIDGSFYIFSFQFPSHVYCTRINASSLVVTPQTVVVSDAKHAHFDVDTAAFTSFFYLVYAKTSNQLSVAAWSSSLVKITVGIPEQILPYDGVSAAIKVHPATLNVSVAYRVYASNSIRAVLYNSSLSVISADQIIITHINVSENAPIIIGVSASWVCFIFDSRNVSLNLKITSIIKYNISTLTYSSASDLYFHSRLSSRAFTYNNVVCFIIKNDSSFQSSYFVVDQDKNILARLHPEEAENYALDKTVLPTVQDSGTGDFRVALSYIRRIISINSIGIIKKEAGVAITKISFDKAQYFRGTTLAGNLHIPGGIVRMYDGNALTEHGFLCYPEIISVTPPAGTGTLYSYSFVAVYEWIDAHGHTHRSAPSVPYLVTAYERLGLSTSVKVKENQFTNKQNVKVVIYSTVQNGSVHYRMSAYDGSDVSYSLGVYTFSLDDILITSNEILYTQGGVLPNYCPPACKYINVFNNRLFLSGLEDPYNMMYSKELEEGAPVEFSGDFIFSIDREDGPITGQGVIDDKLITFKKNSLYFNYGQGPDKLGTGSYYLAPQYISSDSGCIDQRTVARMKAGLIYKSVKGFYLLTSGFEQVAIGESVEDYISLETNSATVNSKENNVVFTHTSGLTLAYDYMKNLWSSFTTFVGNDSVEWRDKIITLSGTEIFKENQDVYTAEVSGVLKYNLIKIETGWISMSDINGFQRIQRATLTNDFLGPHKVRLKVGYDYSDAWDEYLFDSDLELDPLEYSSAKLASLNLKGGAGLPYKFEVHLEQQKCSAIRFRIEEELTDSSPGVGRSLSLTSLSLLFGIKAGVSKNKKRIGV